MKIRRLTAVFAVVVSAVLVTVVLPPSASAHSDTRYYSVARLFQSNNITGASAQMNQAQMYIDPWVGNDHINNVLWIVLSGSAHRWVEMGYRNGFDSGNPCSCIVYQQYRGEKIGSNYVRTTLLNTVPNGANYTMQMERVHSGGLPSYFHWDYRVNGSWVGSGQSSTLGMGNRIDVGGELAHGSGGGNRSHDAVAATFSNTNLQHKVAGSGFVFWTSASTHSITVPCGSSPHCMNANQVSGNRFDWNKP